MTGAATPATRRRPTVRGSPPPSRQSVADAWGSKCVTAVGSKRAFECACVRPHSAANVSASHRGFVRACAASSVHCVRDPRGAATSCGVDGWVVERSARGRVGEREDPTTGGAGLLSACFLHGCSLELLRSGPCGFSCCRRRFLLLDVAVLGCAGGHSCTRIFRRTSRDGTTASYPLIRGTVRGGGRQHRAAVEVASSSVGGAAAGIRRGRSRSRRPAALLRRDCGRWRIQPPWVLPPRRRWSRRSLSRRRPTPLTGTRCG